MDASFSQALKLTGMSFTTSAVVGIMLFFLLILLVGFVLFFTDQMNKKQKRHRESANRPAPGPEGF